MIFLHSSWAYPGAGIRPLTPVYGFGESIFPAMVCCTAAAIHWASLAEVTVMIFLLMFGVGPIWWAIDLVVSLQLETISTSIDFISHRLHQR